MNKYSDFLEIQKALEEADVPTENRTFRIAKHAFLELGGTEEQWERLEKQQTDPTSKKENNIER